MNMLGKVPYKVYRIVADRVAIMRELRCLNNADDEGIKRLAAVLDSVIKNRCSREEKDWIKKIETLRNRLIASSDKISFTDYGAGSPDLNLTDDEMYQGKVVVSSIGEICRSASKPYRLAFLLFKLVRAFRPLVCLEMGTALGISTAYQAAALELNHCGKIVTLEGAESLASLAKENFERFDLKRIEIVIGRFQNILQNVLYENAAINFIFIDGHHDENATLSYFRQILPYLSDGAVLVLDDIHWSQGMERAWNTIWKDRNLKVSVDFLGVGICIFTALAVEETKHFEITFQ